MVAATLLDLKVAGLLPQGELVDAEDVALLEARDLLFARLLQYRAFKEAARWFAGTSRPRPPGTRARCGSRRSSASSTPELVWTLSRRRLRGARHAGADAPRDPGRRPRPPARAARVSIREQAAHVVAVLRARRAGDLPRS